MVKPDLTHLQSLREEGITSLFPTQTKISVGMATCGMASGAEEVYAAIRKEIEKEQAPILLGKTGCIGLCQKEPLVSVVKPGWPRIIYFQVGPELAAEIVKATLSDKVLPKHALCQILVEENLPEEKVIPYSINHIPEGLQHIQRFDQVPFFGLQNRRILRNSGLIDPDNIHEYLALGGYRALERALFEYNPEEIIQVVIDSGMRGRGGAGFPTGRKWDLCRRGEGEPKYVICNADEGDPGAYMDRGILESDPHSVIEGMIIGAYAMGASSGIIYVRMEYPLAIEKLKTALSQAQKYGLLGENILGSGFNFSIEIECGSGAFVCGEETALIASIEGKTGEPRQRPPFPAQSGLWGKPTNINNVKTWANIPLIISRGAKWFSSIGTATNTGTAVFSLVGKVQNNGLVEVPMGTPLNTLIHDIGGGMTGGKSFKAVQTGGPSGGCIPYELAEIPVDYERLAEVGSIMGSGGMVVMDDDTCMVDVAKYFLSFTKEESCGKCVPCREGIRRMHEILVDITEGHGQEGDIELLQEMSQTIIDSALCGLGGTAPNPVLSTIRYFAEEYQAHIKEKRCPAGACKALTSYYIEPSRCLACMICMRNCPVEAISGGRDLICEIDQEKCTKCGNCYLVCPQRFGAVVRLSGVPVPPPIPEEKRVLIRQTSKDYDQVKH